ncbi:SDR family oxidoreductase [Luteithermobacter gelatinilyticus]|uniref:SDR family oxidoreductase n=1 Tax=Luteithermobacter gelatinilyticus TaxID=2582913 RepID=UPI0011062B64|nr:SDR family oxidoreductase [Luteithermobacter gelatinilyticus]|tara:strand:- start:8169 stop:8942 length:774 start_codon:yes stop_codon:yes gene_type:complete
MKTLFDISGKTAVITGGSRGIGAMIARGFVENGVRTYICSRKEEQVRKTVEELSAYGTCIGLKADLSTYEGVVAFAEAIKEREQRLDILVNNAGAAWGAPFEDFPESGWDKVMDVNVKGVFFLTQKLFPLLRAAGRHEDPARVVNIASVDGQHVPDPETYSYSASKAAVIHMTRVLAKRLAADHINVTAIAPGPFPSAMTKGLFEAVGTDKIIREVPRGRIGEPEDMAGAAIYLCSRAGSYVTGATLTVDGGWATTV